MQSNTCIIGCLKWLTSREYNKYGWRIRNGLLLCTLVFDACNGYENVCIVFCALHFFYRKLTSEKEKLEVLSKNEKDYLTTIRGLRLNLENVMKKAEEQATAITKLAASNVQLKEENKVSIRTITYVKL